MTFLCVTYTYYKGGVKQMKTHNIIKLPILFIFLKYYYNFVYCETTLKQTQSQKY